MKESVNTAADIVDKMRRADAGRWSAQLRDHERLTPLALIFDLAEHVVKLEERVKELEARR